MKISYFAPFNIFCFPSCDNTPENCNQMFLSNFILFTCILKDQGENSPETFIGKMNKSERGLFLSKRDFGIKTISSTSFRCVKYYTSKVLSTPLQVAFSTLFLLTEMQQKHCLTLDQEIMAL